MFRILLDFRPEPFVGSSYLPFHTTGQLRGETIVGTEFSIHAFVQSGYLAGFALLKSVGTYSIERIPIGQLGLSKCLKLVRSGDELEFCCDDLLHATR